MLMDWTGSICTATFNAMSLVSFECIHDVPRPVVGAQRDDVKTAGLRGRQTVLRQKVARRSGNAPGLAGRDGFDRAIEIIPAPSPR